MSKIKLSILVSVVMLGSSLNADMSEAKELFDGAKCMECHNKEDFKHRKEKVNNFKKLVSSVNSCALASKAQWFDDDVHGVAKYLNKNHYHYKSTEIEEQ